MELAGQPIYKKLLERGYDPRNMRRELREQFECENRILPMQADTEDYKTKYIDWLERYTVDRQGVIMEWVNRSKKQSAKKQKEDTCER